MTDLTDYTQCSECGKQCQNDGHCIGGMGGKDTKCPGFIRYVPKIRVEKDVWESTLHRSMVLQAENEKLKERVSKLEKMQYSYTPEEWNTMLRTVNRTKELLKECELWFTGVVGNMNDKNVGEHNKSVPIGNFEYIFKEFSKKINEVLK